MEKAENAYWKYLSKTMGKRKKAEKKEMLALLLIEFN